MYFVPSASPLRPPKLFPLLGLFFVLSGQTRAPGADVSYYAVMKGILFNQAGTAQPAIRTGLPYVFEAVVQPGTNTVRAARLQWSAVDLPLNAITTPNAFGFVQRVRTQDQLDATFPTDGYRIVVQSTNDGTNSGTLAISGNGYPFAPFLHKLSEAQAIDPAAPYTLSWNPFIDGTTNDFIFVQIETSQGRVFATGMDPTAAGALDGTASSVVIPADTLQPGRAYAARVAFYRLSDRNTNDYPGVLGAGGYFAQTDFYLATTGSGDITPPALLSTSPADGETGVAINEPIVFRFNETMNRGFALGISPGSFGRTFDWSPDGRVLVATPVTNWPANTTLVWTLNLFYTQLAFGDTNANPLPMETVLTFTTGSTTVSNPPPILAEHRILPNGRFLLEMTGQTNRTYTIQATTNFTQWTSLTTQVAFNGQIEFLDTNAPAWMYRFYRAEGR